VIGSTPRVVPPFATRREVAISLRMGCWATRCITPPQGRRILCLLSGNPQIGRILAGGKAALLTPSA